MNIRVGFDISQLAHRGGVATYTQKLAEYLMQDKSIDPVFFYSSLRKSYQGNLKPIKTLKMPPTLFEKMFNNLRFPYIETFIGSVDIFHSSDWTQPKSRAKKVTTYHDLVAILHPEWSRPKIVEVNRKRLKLVEKEVDLVIAVSESTKKDLMQVSKIPESKIIVIYEGVGEEFKPQKELAIEQFRKKYNLPDTFVLSIGGVGERRNLDGIKFATDGLNLVITGQTIPYLSPEELPLLYAAADVLLYPSFYEGFGLPILESMAVGTPVITSNISSMPEIAGDAALLVDPKDKEQIKKVLKELLTDKKLQKELREKGLKRAKQFSWQKCGEETVNVYKKLLRVNG